MNDFVDPTYLVDQARDFVLGKEGRGSSEDSNLDEDGRFLALESFSNSEEGRDEATAPVEEIKEKRKNTQKRQARSRNKSRNRRTEENTDETIEKSVSIDSLVFKETSCVGMIGEYFGVNPESIVVKILVSRYFLCFLSRQIKSDLNHHFERLQQEQRRRKNLRDVVSLCHFPEPLLLSLLHGSCTLLQKNAP